MQQHCNLIKTHKSGSALFRTGIRHSRVRVVTSNMLVDRELALVDLDYDIVESWCLINVLKYSTDNDGYCGAIMQCLRIVTS